MIVVAGEALVDLVIDPAGRVTAALGGAPFNTARVCGRLGVDVAFAGSISVDRFGSLLVARLADDRVDTAHVVRTELPTTLAAAELDDDGAATYRFYIAGTSAPAFVSVPSIPAPDVFYTGGLAFVLEPMAETVETMLDATDDSTLVVVDVNCRPLVVGGRAAYVERIERILGRVDVVKVSDEDLAYLAPDSRPADAAGRLLSLGPRAVLLTEGSTGVRVFTEAAATEVRIRPVEVVDTIGAGDSFGGGFVSWWTESGRGRAEAGSLDDLVPAVEAANAVAGVVCTRRGADPPWRDELPADWAP